MEQVMTDGAMSMELGATMERLAAAAEMLEQVVEQLHQRQSSFAEDTEASIGKIVATVESRRELELEQRLVAAEARLLSCRRGVLLPRRTGRARRCRPR